VFDLAGGKSGWRERGLPMQGTGPFRYVAGQVLTPATATCLPDALSDDIRAMLRSNPVCVVVNEQGIVLGRVRRKDLPEEDHARAADFMQLGPATVQRREELGGLVQRMRKAGVTTIIVTTPKGELVGIVDRDDAERLLAGGIGPSAPQGLSLPDA
jgi:predicted transcriptional regulator